MPLSTNSFHKMSFGMTSFSGCLSRASYLKTCVDEGKAVRPYASVTQTDRSVTASGRKPVSLKREPVQAFPISVSRLGLWHDHPSSNEINFIAMAVGSYIVSWFGGLETFLFGSFILFYSSNSTRDWINMEMRKIFKQHSQHPLPQSNMKSGDHLSPSQCATKSLTLKNAKFCISIAT